MRNFFLTAIIVMKSFVAFSQIATISGTVKDGNGNAISMAFVRDAKHSYATYTNVNGSFNLQADPNSILIASAANQKDKAVKIDNKVNIDFVMAPADTIKAVAATTKMAADQSLFQQGFFASTLGDVNIRLQQLETTKGSRYLYDSWVHGFAVSKGDSIIQSSDYLCNYDKTTGDFLFSKNRRDALTANKSQIKSFTLFSDDGKSVTYSLVPAINSNKFVAVISAGNRYTIYKDLGTKFIKANFVTNGITSSGNNYDEYVDDTTYYIAKAGAQPQKVSLKKKSIKNALAADAEKVSKFMDAQSGDIDDTYFANLGEQLNN